MRNLLFIMFSVLLTTSCTKFNATLDENELFSRLSAGEGTWRIVTIDTWDATVENPVVTSTNPSDAFYHFYIKSKYISGNVVQLDYVDYFENQNLDFNSTISAQEERVVFEGALGSGTVWTVIKNKRKEQVWLYLWNGQVTQITLKKEDFEIPGSTVTETGG